jgi:hypothetical protein
MRPLNFGRTADLVAGRVSRSGPAATVRDRIKVSAERRSIETGQFLEIAQRLSAPETLTDAEFRVFSQFGEDGVLSWLTNALGIRQGRFVEIGVQTYEESNTRYLAQRVRNPWRGAAVDMCDAHERFLGNHPLGWQIDVKPVTIAVTADNVNDVAHDALDGETVDLLSIDIDGVDYWVWKAFDLCKPSIVVIEYNPCFGPNHAVTVPYQPDFDASNHLAGVYFGASLAALTDLAEAKGYTFVGATSTGVNAFFVREDLAGTIGWISTVAEAWRDPRFANARPPSGELLPTRQNANKLDLVRGLELVDTRTGSRLTIEHAFAED